MTSFEDITVVRWDLDTPEWVDEYAITNEHVELLRRASSDMGIPGDHFDKLLFSGFQHSGLVPEDGSINTGVLVRESAFMLSALEFGTFTSTDNPFYHAYRLDNPQLSSAIGFYDSNGLVNEAGQGLYFNRDRTKSIAEACMGVCILPQINWKYI